MEHTSQPPRSRGATSRHPIYPRATLCFLFLLLGAVTPVFPQTPVFSQTPVLLTGPVGFQAPVPVARVLSGFLLSAVPKNPGTPVNPKPVNSGTPVNPKPVDPGTPVNPKPVNSGTPVNPKPLDPGTPVDPEIPLDRALPVISQVLTPVADAPPVDPVHPIHLSYLLQSSNFTPACRFESHDLTFVAYETKNFSLFVTGNIKEDVILMFNFHGDNILERLPNVTLTPGEGEKTFNIVLVATSVGHTILVVNATPENMTDVSDAFVRVSVSHSEDLDYFSDVVGWVYFTAWSVSFYPQTYINWRRKSVIGLHFDFLSLNIVGFFLYSLFNVCLYWAPSIKQQYFLRHPFGVNPVQLNDVIFSLHAFFACSIQVIQCCVYERGDQQISKTAKTILAGIVLSTLVMVILGSAVVIQWLDFLYFVSYVKLFITLIKYIPQAYYNYRRKSTSGWSIGNILLDFTGGTLSVAQMFIIAYNYNDWGSIFGDPTKFGLGLFSVIFDIFFMIQHYVLYRGTEGYQRNLSSPQPTHSSSLTESVSSVDYGAVGSIY